MTVTLTWAKQNVGARGYAKPIQVQYRENRADTGRAEPSRYYSYRER